MPVMMPSIVSAKQGLAYLEMDPKPMPTMFKTLKFQTHSCSWSTSKD